MQCKKFFFRGNVQNVDDIQQFIPEEHGDKQYFHYSKNIFDLLSTKIDVYHKILQITAL